MQQQKKTVGFNKGGKSEHRNRVSKKPGKATLTEVGIGKNLANRARKAAKPSDQEFEVKITVEKEQIQSPVKLNIVPEVKKPKRVELQLPDATEQCVAKIRLVVEDTLAQMRRGGAQEGKMRHLFQTLFDVLRALENKTLPPKSVEQSVEERRAVNAKLAEEQPA